MNIRFLITLFFSIVFTVSQGQYWQQRVEYSMDIDFDAEKHQFIGDQELTYFNNSPDTLTRVFYHLFFNAFQPGSMMDMRTQNRVDPDQKLIDIVNFTTEESGYLHVVSLSQNGNALQFEEQGTILVVDLVKPILPGKKAIFTMKFNGQVPVQTRRSGRDNAEGVAYSMAQWYPKLSEYDTEGWHADPYIGREFYGVWGDYKVNITIDSEYVLGGTGFVKNPKEVKHGYGGYSGVPESEKITWRFEAENVHDFMWAADKNYLHKIVKVNDELDVHLLYIDDSDYNPNWDTLATIIPSMFNYVNWRFGKYGFKKYSIIQGGDGGMEYPMATLITGFQSFRGLLGVTVHELMHSWYQMALGSNELKSSWLDEGFTSYASGITMNYLRNGDSLGVPNYSRAMKSVIYLTESDKNEPLSIQADHYLTRFAYSVNAYSKGAIYLHQLSYIIGQKNLNETLRRYYDQWKYKHPDSDDFLLVAEKVSGLELNWYNEYYVYTTRKVDYAIKAVYGKADETKIVLERKEDFILPVDLQIELKDGKELVYNIPLQIMRGHKPAEKDENMSFATPWPWVSPTYELTIPYGINDIKSLHIDPEVRTTDTDRENNDLEINTDEGLLYILER